MFPPGFHDPAAVRAGRTPAVIISVQACAEFQCRPLIWRARPGRDADGNPAALGRMTNVRNGSGKTLYSALFRVERVLVRPVPGNGHFVANTTSDG